MNKFLIKIVLLFTPLWNRLGVQVDYLEIILATKLKMDGRRASTFSRNSKGKKSNNLDLRAMFSFLVMGLFFMTILFQVELPLSSISIYLTMWMVVLALTLISDFTDVLIDVRDNYILMPRPVNDRTLTISRLLHVFLYLLRLVLAFVIPGMIYMIFQHGFLGTALFLFQVFLSVILTIFIVNIIYLFILRYTSQQKFKEIINYFQIGFVIFIMTGYYILPRLIDFDNAASFNIMETSWGMFLPSVWIANIWSVLMDGNTDVLSLILAALGLLSPFVALYFVATVLSKNFSQKLIGLGQGSAATSEPEVRKDKSSEAKGMQDWWGSKITKYPEEEAGFQLAWKMTSRSRDYKLKTYPLFGFIPAFFIYLALDGKGSLAERWDVLLASDKYLLLIYICIYGTIVPLFNLRYSDKFKSSWIFYALPIERPGLLLLGSVKAILVRFILPIFAVSALLAVLIWGFKTLDDILLGAANVMVMTALVGWKILDKMPFSESWSTQSKGSNFSWTFGIMFLLFIFGGLHWVALDYPWALLLWTLASSLLSWYLFYRFRTLDWSKIKY